MRQFNILKIVFCSFLAFSQTYSQEAKIQAQLNQVFALDQNTELSEATINTFVTALKSIDSYTLADDLFSKNKSKLERFLSNPKVQFRAEYYSVSGGREGNGIATLLQSYYQDKVADIMKSGSNDTKLQALKQLCNGSTPDVREAIKVGLYRFESDPIIKQFKEYLKNPANFLSSSTPTRVEAEPVIPSAPARAAVKISDSVPTAHITPEPVVQKIPAPAHRAVEPVATTTEEPVEIADEEDNENEDAISLSDLPDDTTIAAGKKVGIDPALYQVLATRQKVLKKIRGPLSLSTKSPEKPSEEESAQDDSSDDTQASLALLRGLTTTDIIVTVSRRIVPLKLRNMVATLALYGPYVLRILGEPIPSLAKGFTSLLGKDQNELDPLEEALKVNLDVLSNILTVLDTANPDHQKDITNTLDAFANVARVLNYTQDATAKKFYQQFFSDSKFQNNLDATTREEFAKKLEGIEKDQGESAAIAFFKTHLKPEAQNKSQALYHLWKAQRTPPGKAERILKSLAFVVKHHDLLQKAFKGYSPIGLYFFKENTAEKRWTRLQATIGEYNIGKQPKDHISIADTQAMWQELDNIYKFVSLGKFVKWARVFAFNTVNLYRKITFRKTRDFTEYEYKDAAEMTEEINNSWVGTLVKTGQFLIKIGRVVGSAVSTLNVLRIRVQESRVVTSLLRMTKSAYEEVSSTAVQNVVQPVQESARYYFSKMVESVKALASRSTSDVQDNVRVPDVVKSILGDTDNQGFARILVTYVVTAGSSLDPKAAATNLVTHLSGVCFEAAQSDKPFTREQTTRILVETLVRELMEEVKAQKKRAGLIVDEAQQAEYERKIESAIKDRILLVEADINDEMNKEESSGGFLGNVRSGAAKLWGGARKWWKGSKATDTEYLQRFNAILTDQIPAITEKLVERFDAIEGITSRDPNHLANVIRARIEAEYEKALKEYEKQGTIIDDDAYEAAKIAMLNDLTTKALAQITSTIQGRNLSDAAYLSLFKSQLDSYIQTSQEGLKNSFDALESRFTRAPFQDAVEQQPVRTLPTKPNSMRLSDEVTSYEQAAYDRLFVLPIAGQTKLSSYQQLLHGIDNRDKPSENGPLRTLISAIIEFPMLQSDSYRAELQTTGVSQFYQGLDTRNNVTRLVDGASSLNNMLRQLETSDHKDLMAIIQAARLAGIAAHDTLIADFFTNYCTDTTPNQRTALLEKMVNSNISDDDKMAALKDVLKPELQSNVADLYATLQSHLHLSARLETSLFFLEHHKTLDPILRSSKSDEELVTVISHATRQKAETIQKILPALKNYNKSMNFFKGRRVQFMKSISYKLKNFWQALTRGVKVVSYSRFTFKSLKHVQTSVNNCWVKGFKQNPLPENLLDPVFSSPENWQQFVQEHQPEVVAPAPVSSEGDEEDTTLRELTTLAADMQPSLPSTTDAQAKLRQLKGITDIFVSAFSDGTTDSSSVSDTVLSYITHTSELDFGPTIRQLAPTRTIDFTLQARALCGLTLLHYLGETTLDENFSQESFNTLVDQLYNKIRAQFPQKAQPSVTAFNEKLNQLTEENDADGKNEIDRMVSTMLQGNLEIDETTHDEDPLSRLQPAHENDEPQGRPRSGSTASTISNDSFKSFDGEEDEFHDASDETEEEKKERLEKEQQEAQEKAAQAQRQKVEEMRQRAESIGAKPGMVKQITEQFESEGATHAA